MINALIYDNGNDPFISRGLLRNNCKYVLRKRTVTIFKFIEEHYEKIWIYKMKNNLVEYLYVWF